MPTSLLLETPNAYRCPACREEIERSDRALTCSRCSKSYPVEGAVADFSEGRYYDRFTPGQSLTQVEREGLENEVPGAMARIRDFYLPILRRDGRRRVLDNGCGNGMSIDLLDEAGLDAWGVDLSALRKWQWGDRRRRDRLACADGSRLPFANGFFDAILCSGVVEHIGVAESREPKYRVRVKPDRDAARTAFLVEQTRVLSPGGSLFLDFPNGAFPIDFWHGSSPGAPRWHSRSEGFLPTAGEVRRYAAAVPGSLTVRALDASGRLQFRQVGRHWYGRLLSRPASLWLLLLGHRPLSPLLETWLNPFLVLELRKSERRPQ